uniref:Reverse transcriptase Ty1/copia-type domain-containing protein n=1 Tax=Amphimedon queenslandica TaxID=400682 RepID=A0A1X7VJ81_AMPQE
MWGNSPLSLQKNTGLRIIRYLKGTQDYGLLYKRDSSDIFVGYSDSDFSGDSDDHRSTSGYIFQIGGAGIRWRSKKLTSVALSTAEAEYVALSLLLKKLFGLLLILVVTQNLTVIYEDNQAAICMAINPTSKSKNIEIKYH